MIDTPYESIINTAVEKHFSSRNRYYGIVASDENGTKVPSNSSQIIKKIELVDEVFLPQVSNPNDSIMSKN